MQADNDSSKTKNMSNQNQIFLGWFDATTQQNQVSFDNKVDILSKVEKAENWSWLICSTTMNLFTIKQAPKLNTLYGRRG